MGIVKYGAAIFLVLVAVGGVFIYSGIYPMGADVPHNKLTYWMLETLREKSIESASNNIQVPPLDDPDLLLAGGADYNDMCASCHLQPGRTRSDMSIGLYPAPPNLSQSNADHDHAHVDADGRGDTNEGARRQFWIIKHGIKASGMPAWGPTHDDERIWAMVAFLQKLPNLNEFQYQILTARGESASQEHLQLK